MDAPGWTAAPGELLFDPEWQHRYITERSRCRDCGATQTENWFHCPTGTYCASCYAGSRRTRRIERSAITGGDPRSGAERATQAVCAQGDQVTQPSVRERVKKIQGDLRDGALTPDLTRESLVTLTALLGNVNDEQRVADLDYKHVLRAAYESEQKANRARLVAETSPEYARSREAKDTRELVIEMIRSCRAYLRSLDEEMRLAR